MALIASIEVANGHPRKAGVRRPAEDAVLERSRKDRLASVPQRQGEGDLIRSYKSRCRTILLHPHAFTSFGTKDESCSILPDAYPHPEELLR